VKFTLCAVRRSASLEESQLEILSDSITLIEDTIFEVREIAHDLIPAVLKDFGLQAAISKICERAGKLYHFEVIYETRGKVPLMADNEETAICRIAQEIISNAEKYSKADAVHIKLSFVKGEVVLFIKDDGVGLDLSQSVSGAGINIMKERCAMIDAKCNISSILGEGTLTVIKYNLE
jgi:signal transduction histidine kinase